MAQGLLEAVAAGQTRFRLQGITPDGRGIAVGREALLTFDTLDRLVAFLGAYSEEANLDDLMPSVTLERVERQGGGQLFALRCRARDGYAIDRLARLTGAVRGRVYVGGGSVFIRARERSAPFGYDLALSLGELRKGTHADILVIDLDFSSAYTVVERLDPVELIQRLALRPEALPRGGIGGDPELAGCREMALVLVAPGLSERLLSYLWRTGNAFSGVRVSLGEEGESSLLLRLKRPNGRLLDVLYGMPGIEILAPVSARAAVEVGFRHPIHLASANTCFPGDEMYLFRGLAGRVERIDGAPRFVDGRHLLRTDLTIRSGEIGGASLHDPRELHVELKLRPSSNRREPRASLIPWEQLEYLRRLVYLLPPSTLSAASVVALEDGVLVMTSGGRATGKIGVTVGTMIPIGKRYVEVAPGVLLPDGFELWPCLRPNLLRELLGLQGEDRALFPEPGAEPLLIPAARSTPLDAALIGRLRPQVAETVEPAMPTLEDGRIENRRLGRFALWGFRRGGG